MRELARHAVRGFAFGLGFAAAAALAWLVAREAGSLAEEIGALGAGGAPPRVATGAGVGGIADPAQRVRVASHRVVRRHGDAIVLGVLRNDADGRVGSARVEAAYYDAEGRLVDLCGWYVAPSLEAGEEKPFKITCGGQPERPSPESASVRFRIVEAF